MTALDNYDRLECEGEYRAGSDADTVSVVVKFGNASLTITTFDDVPLAHWPLASLHMTSQDDGRLFIAPEVITDVALLIADRTMREALTEVIATPRRRRRASRRTIIAVLSILGTVLVGGGLWVSLDPYRLMAAQVPRAVATQLGLTALSRHAGKRLCLDPAGQRALDHFASQLAPDPMDEALTIRVVRGDGQPATTVGGVLMLPSSTVTEAGNPTALAAVALATQQDSIEEASLTALMRAVGFTGLVAIMRGNLTAAPLVAGAAAMLATGSEAPATSAARADQPQINGIDWLAISAICE